MTPKPRVLYLGAPLRYKQDQFKEFCEHFEIITEEVPERQKFIQNLKDKKYGDFAAILKPHFESGNDFRVDREGKRFDKEIIDLLPSSMKIMAGGGAGFDPIDTIELGKRGIYYCNCADAPAEATSDTAIYLIIGVFRLLSWAEQATRCRDPAVFNDVHDKLLTATCNPNEKVLGMVGMGLIARKIARKARALGMVLHYYDPFRAPKEVEEEYGLVYHEDLHEMLAISDCVNLSVPYMESTHHLIDEAALKAMKPGSRIVNTARGPVIDEKALIVALKSGHISSAGLDVFEFEPEVPKELAEMYNVTLTCHAGGGSRETIVRFEELTMLNIKTYIIDGKDPISPVNTKVVKTALFGKH
ncbi:the Holo forms of Rhodotorula Graminis D-mandelate dehydrogenase At 2.5a [Saitoella complicata NRRL Y-17804]|uniref:D-isomer specific 2-hydroxyacid dehydrogenase NAD-binding domain-containing protein n=1 Tax=Saitoella complicata (strain BCRC 22490 / CBS 7301 / JCM 7358 / NBRC 10748 / NRRL Y-17804) TaxID=698492 RepID=A0A0E9NII8_SAICN|nr:the Holo forms of Rhodotorula Graminis D-mandelate dehydrogenase At 2.5a [Saitoella complicata NRRL Y-17804]ODQ49995.1 the Holo forms of Rhodotorula Graminis D-mandelate dehydrogenase At 2.5a [Saitoella complicata NRRL Y-17804]GAO49687.1 hypothetical protein G7K_3833-t1 [Saitoella complicata NRRL Y-17804]